MSVPAVAPTRSASEASPSKQPNTACANLTTVEDCVAALLQAGYVVNTPRSDKWEISKTGNSLLCYAYSRHDFVQSAKTLLGSKADIGSAPSPNVAGNYLAPPLQVLGTTTYDQGEKMTNHEIAKVISKGQEDGTTLYRVAHALYKVNMAFNWLIGILGVATTIFLASRGEFVTSLGVSLATSVTCAIGYAAAVFGSHGAKVLVHILFSNLAILSKGQLPASPAPIEAPSVPSSPPAQLTGGRREWGL